MKIQDRIKEFVRVPASQLNANPKNWRSPPPEQQRAIQGILEEVGYADALIAYETDQGLTLIDGHLRANTTPDETVPVLVLDVNEEEADKILATLDPLAVMATSDHDQLNSLLESVNTDSPHVPELLDYISNGIVPGFEPLGMWEPDIGDVSNINATDDEIEEKFVVRCPMSQSDNVKTELENMCDKYPGVTIA